MNNYKPLYNRMLMYRNRFLAILVFTLFPLAAIAQNEAPVLTATGDQVYCPGTALNIVTDFDIDDPDDTGTLAVYIQISSGFVNGQDVLSLTGSHPTVTAAWNATTAKLTITGVGGNVPYADLIAAVEDVVYNNTASNPASGTRTFSMTVGQANYLPSTQHYYQYVSNLNISWTSAKAAAEAATYYGLQGYLATLLSAEEAQLCGEQATGTGWIGGNDAAVEGVWKWVTGPEAGTVFWNGAANGSSPNFEFWNNQEPNDSGGNEDYAHITAPGVGFPGSWNDLPNNGGDGDYQAKGYIVEYGGMPGDPVLQISASSTIDVVKLTGTTPASRCGTGTVTLQGITTGVTVYWYAAATGGNPLGTGSSFTTPSISATTTYYASAYNEDCNAARTAVIATVNPIPAITVTTPVNACQGSTATLQATPSAGAIVSWYTVPTGGTAVATGNTFTTQVINANTTYYAEAVANACPSSREAINITAVPLPTITVVTPADICGQGTAALEATPSAGTVSWYTSATGGTPFATGNSVTSPPITATTTFYAEASNNGCTSAARTPVTVTVIQKPTVTVTSPAYVCEEGTATLTGTASAGTINWYDAPTNGTLIATGNSITSPYLTADTTFYAEGDNNGCLSATRIPVNVEIITLPTLTVTTPVTVCDENSLTLEAIPSAGTVNWYTTATGGTPVATGDTFTTPAITADTTYYAEAENNGCPSAAREAVSITVLANPDVEDEAVIFCENGDIDLDAGLTDVTYDWSTGETTKVITIDTAGTYTVEVTNTAGCSSVKTFTATTLQAPDITDVQVNSDNATIIMSDGIVSNYEYSLDGVNYQASNVFTKLFSGYKTAYARSINNCGEDTEPFVIYLIPKFFTPNGDSVNDQFTIAGMIEFPESEIKIFDRYGKLIAHLHRSRRSWDGTLNGRPLPATDYWYIIKIDNTIPEIKGHFSLMR